MKLGRKISGGKYKKQRKKKLCERKGLPRVVKLGKKRAKILRVRGGHEKLVLLSADIVSIIDMKTGKSKTAKIKNVLETPSDRFLARQNVLTKGTIIETDAGKARITNRPSQEGMVQAVLIKN